MLIIHACLIAA